MIRAFCGTVEICNVDSERVVYHGNAVTVVFFVFFLEGFDMSGTFHNRHMTYQFNKSRALNITGNSVLRIEDLESINRVVLCDQLVTLERLVL